uniref:NADH:ubiquinone oxidoreductase 30kDa subunit domain-containing protein n=1 Tax=Solanum lycopersicum TaxID=4081 RepID=K4CJY7_SOLLC
MKWVKKRERSKHGNRYDTNMDYLFQLLCFLKLHTYTRVNVSTDIYEVTQISPVVSLFPSADRWEREVLDMFCVSSINHPEYTPNINKLLFRWSSITKDLPLSGYVEVHYDDLEKCVVS